MKNNWTIVWMEDNATWMKDEKRKTYPFSSNFLFILCFFTPLSTMSQDAKRRLRLYGNNIPPAFQPLIVSLIFFAMFFLISLFFHEQNIHVGHLRRNIRYYLKRAWIDYILHFGSAQTTEIHFQTDWSAKLAGANTRIKTFSPSDTDEISTVSHQGKETQKKVLHTREEKLKKEGERKKNPKTPPIKRKKTNDRKSHQFSEKSIREKRFSRVSNPVA